MSKVQMLRCLVNQRLTAAAEEIFSLFERTIAEYEEERRRLLQTRADVQRPLVVIEEVPCERHEWSSGLYQGDPEPPHIKEERVELSIQEVEQLQGPEEVCIDFPFTSVIVKTEEDADEEDQSSRLHESRTEDGRGAERLKTEAGEDNCGGSESASDSDPDGPFQPATCDETSSSSESDDETSSSSESETDVPVSDDEWDAGCVEGARSFGHGGRLQKLSPSGVHSDGKRFGCPVCKASFSSSASLVRHGRTHSGGKPFRCSVCGKEFTLNQHLKRHLALHTGEKPFSCSDCGRGFAQEEQLKRHTFVHTGEKPLSCSVCSRRFTQQGNLTRHMTVHTREKPLSCSLCSRRFTQQGHLTRHMTIHAGEKRFSCSFCGKGFSHQGNLKQHLTSHAGEKPFSLL